MQMSVSTTSGRSRSTAAASASRLSVDSVITHRFGVEQFEEAFQVAASCESGKVILEWT